MWYGRLKEVLQALGFKDCITDSSLFILCRSMTMVLLFVYVNDIVVCGANDELVHVVFGRLGKEFPLEILEISIFFLVFKCYVFLIVFTCLKLNI